MDQPGSGDSGGMNVYIRAVAERLAEHGVDVDVFTRCRGADDPEVLEIGAGRAKSSPSRPARAIPSRRANYHDSCLSSSAGCCAGHERGHGYDIVHSHYWLSGLMGR